MKNEECEQNLVKNKNKIICLICYNNKIYITKYNLNTFGLSREGLFTQITQLLYSFSRDGMN